ncbi:MAG: hypothetical protein ACRCSU_08670 [Paracoccaceae bacterium]
MDSDLYLVIGLCIGGLAFPSLIGAFSAGRPPRTAAIMVMIASGLILFAIQSKPSGYSLGEVPEAFSRVVARFAH